MGDEAVEGSKMGTKLIMFVAIVALALVAFLVGKNLVNTGVDSMETAVASISDSRFSDYDKKTVRGRTVKSALDTFANEEYAIVICTLLMADAGDLDGLENYTQGATKQITIDGATMKDSAGYDVTTVIGANYNALLGEHGDTSVELKMTNGSVAYDQDFSIDDAGNVEYYLDTMNLTKKGAGEYIADASSFTANLIKNSAGEIVGIVFMQKKLY